MMISTELPEQADEPPLPTVDASAEQADVVQADDTHTPFDTTTGTDEAEDTADTPIAILEGGALRAKLSGIADLELGDKTEQLNHRLDQLSGESHSPENLRRELGKIAEEVTEAVYARCASDEQLAESLASTEEQAQVDEQTPALTQATFRARWQKSGLKSWLDGALQVRANSVRNLRLAL